MDSSTGDKDLTSALSSWGGFLCTKSKPSYQGTPEGLGISYLLDARKKQNQSSSAQPLIHKFFNATPRLHICLKQRAEA